MWGHVITAKARNFPVHAKLVEMTSYFAFLIEPGKRRLRHLAAVFAVGSLIAFACTPNISIVDSETDSGSGGERGDGGTGGSGTTGGMGGASSCNTNNVLDAGETDVDCGGKDCQPCRIGEICKVDPDCENNSCVFDICQNPNCSDGEKNGADTADTDPETDVDCGGTVCPGCGTGKVCIVDSDCRDKNCVDGRCVEPTCEDTRHNGDESDIDCGGPTCEEKCLPGKKCIDRNDCQQPPVDDPSSTLCMDGICRLGCVAGLDNCDQNAANGCETNISTNPAHCGACQADCDLDNVVDYKCEGGNCTIDFEAGGCLSGFLDVNGYADDGCEVDTTSDPLNCGGRDIVCSSNNGTPDCYGGICTIVCEDGFDDCDDDPASNGCEIETDGNVSHCGACDNVCPSDPGESATCDTSVSPDPCGVIECQPTDCEGEPCGDCDGDALCSDPLNTTTNCGGCGKGCAATNATVACVGPDDALACAIDTCVDSGGADYEDCDGNYENGCEADTNTNLDYCGGCAAGNSCSSFVGGNGVTAVDCDQGDCEVVSCTGSLDDCNGDFLDGCEVDTNTSLSHCGACGNACPNKPNSTRSCNAGAACLWTCDNGWVDADEDLQTGTNGCESIDLVYVSPSVTRGQGTTSNTLTFNHTLVTGSGQYRLIVIAVGSQQDPGENGGFPDSVTYGGAAATRVDGVIINNASSSFWLVYDSALGSAGTKSVVVEPSDDWGTFYAEVHEFKGVKQYTTPTNVPSATRSVAGNCVATLIDTTITGVAAGSILLAITSSQAPTANVAAHPANYATPGGTLTTEFSDLVASSAINSLQIASGRSGLLTAGDRAAGFTQTGCWATSLTVVEIEAGP